MMRNQSRNFNPHKEAILAMAVWSYEYAHRQLGGSMDFWDALDESRKQFCRETIIRIDEAPKEAP